MELAPVPFNENERVKTVIKTGLIDSPNSEMFQVYCDLAKDLTGFQSATFSLYDGNNQCSISSSGRDEFVSGSISDKGVNNICAYVLLDTEPLLMPDLRKDPIWKNHPKILNGTATTLGYAGFPVINKDNYALGSLIPVFKAAGASLSTIATTTGISGIHAMRKFGFKSTTTDTDVALTNTQTNAIVIATQHDSHADFVIKALENRKNIFVEKPLCLTLTELDKIKSVYEKVISSMTTTPILMVGFNRRFAPHIQKMKELLYETSGSKSFIMTKNFKLIVAVSLVVASMVTIDKGQKACALAFLNSIKNGTSSPIPIKELFEVSRITIEINQ